MVPDEDSPIPLAHIPCVCVGPRRAVQTWHFGKLAFAVEAPTVEGADDSVAAHTSADAKMGAEVWAVGIEYARGSVLATEEHQLAAKVVHWHYVALGEIIGSANTEPTVW